MAQPGGEGVPAALLPASERKMQDKGFLACFAVTVVTTVALGFAAVGSASSVAAAVTAVFLAIALAGIWLYLLKNHTRAMVWGTVYVTVGLQLLAAVALLVLGNPVAIFLLIMTAVYIAVIYCIRDAINLSADMLELGVTALKDYPSILAADGVVLLVALGAFAVYMVFLVQASLVGAVETVTVDGVTSCEFVQTGTAVLTQYLTAFVMLWTFMTALQVAQYAAAYTAGEWYFNPPERRGEGPAWTGLRLGSTLALGSNAAAGLVLAVVEMMRQAVRQARRRANNLCFSILACIIQVILRLVEFLTNFATIVAAVSGLPFVDAAKRGSTVLKASFFEGYITDVYSKRILYFGAVVLGLLSAVAAWGLLDLQLGTDTIVSQGGYIVVVAILVAMGPLGAAIAALVASAVTGPAAVPFVAAFLGAIATTVAMFVSEVVLDLTNAMFAFYAIDRYNATQSFNATPGMAATIDGFVASTAQGKGARQGAAGAAPAQPRAPAPAPGKYAQMGAAAPHGGHGGTPAGMAMGAPVPGQRGYPAQQGGYPMQQGGYPAQQAGYPAPQGQRGYGYGQGGGPPVGYPK